MKTPSSFVLAILFSCASVVVQAATEQLVATGYNVVTKLPEKVTLPNGSVIMVGAQGHASIVNDKTGEQTSQWCNIDTWVDAKGTQTHAVGHCSVFYDSGDVIWVAVTQTTTDQPVTWTVLGGVGKYAGASGGGTSKVTSRRSDGYADTYKITGTITTK